MTKDQRTFMRKLARRRKQGDTLERLAQRLDVSFATVGRWTRGECTPHSNTARRLAPILED